MLFILYYSAISYQRVYQEKNVKSYFIPEWDFGFEKGGKYTFLFSNLHKDILIYIEKYQKINDLEDIIQSTTKSTINNSFCKLNQTFRMNNFIVINAGNGFGNVSGLIENKGMLRTIIASCDNSVFDFTLHISYSNPNSKLGYNVHPCIKIFPIFIIINVIIFLTMVIFWIYNLSYINIFTILIPIYLMFIIIDKYLLYKILYIHDRYDITTNYSKSYENIVMGKIFLANCIFMLSITIHVSLPNIKLMYIILTLFLSFIISLPIYLISFKEDISLLFIIFSSLVILFNLFLFCGIIYSVFINILHGLFTFLLYVNFMLNLVFEANFEVSNFSTIYILFIVFNSIEIVIFVISIIIFHFNKKFWQKFYTLKVIEKSSDNSTLIFDSDIESIESNEFESSVQRIIFKKDSQLKTIGSNSFINTKIKSITIPSSVINIESNAFRFCPTLKRVNFMETSKISEFKPYTFEFSQIESLYIPSSIVKLNQFWCSNTKMLVNVEISYNNPNYLCYDNSIIVGKNKSNDEIFENLVFAPRNINNVIIPSFVRKISICAFEFCQKITEINFAENSNLRIISKYSFAFSSIVKITIPSSVILIDDYSFNECKKLKNFIINNDSKLKIIGKKAFYNNSSLQSFMIPSSVIKIDEDAFSNCNKLEMLEIKEDSELIIFDKNMFDKLKHLVIFAPTKIIDFNGNC